MSNHQEVCWSKSGKTYWCWPSHDRRRNNMQSERGEVESSLQAAQASCGFHAALNVERIVEGRNIVLCCVALRSQFLAPEDYIV